MITLDYEIATSHDFNNALHTLASMALPMRSAYNVKKISDKLEQARRKISHEWHELKGEKYAETMSLKDESGKPIINEMTGGFKFSPEIEKKMTEELKEFLAGKVIEIDREKLIPTDFEKVSISAWALKTLDPIFQDFETAGGPGKTELSIVPDSSDCPA